jgi:hypothetical protein
MKDLEAIKAVNKAATSPAALKREGEIKADQNTNDLLRAARAGDWFAEGILAGHIRQETA